MVYKQVGVSVFVLILAASARPGFAQDVIPEEEGQEGLETLISFPDEGTVEFDGSEGRLVLPVPDEPRAFDSWEDFANWAVESLNAKAIVDEEGNFGAEGISLAIGDFYYADADTEAVHPIDPLLGYVGGKTGLIIVGGEPFCVNDSVCGSGAQEVTGENPTLLQGAERSLRGPATSFQRPGSVQTTGSFSIRGKSFQSNWWVYAEAGSSTEQRTGGFRRRAYLCWKWIVPWVCYRRSGSNSLSVAADFYQPGWSAPFFSRSRWANNVTSVTYKAWRIGAWGNWASVVDLTYRVRGTHYGSGTGGSDSALSCNGHGC